MESVDQDHRLSFASISTPVIPFSSLTSTPPAHDIDKPARGSFTDSSDPRPASPSSGMTIRKMGASTRVPVGDDDIFSPTQHSTRTLRRRSSRLSKWLQELRDQSSSAQQEDICSPSTDVDSIGTEYPHCLAYPHLNLTVVRTSTDDVSSMHDYVVVNDDDMHDYIPPEEPMQAKPSHGSSALTDTPYHETTTRLINTPPSQPQFNLSVRSASPSGSSASRSPSHLSMFQHTSQATCNSAASNTCGHIRSSSLQAQYLAPKPQSEERRTSSSPSSWRWRPSVLGHFSSPSDGGARSCTHDSQNSSSRPSISSTTTSSSCVTHSNEDRSPPLLQKSHFFGSFRSRSHKAMTSSLSLFKSDTSSNSSPTLLSLPASEPQLSQSSDSLVRKSSTIRLRFSPKSKAPPNSILPCILMEEQEHDNSQPRVVYSGKGHTPRVSLSSIAGRSRSTKKRLVISGIAVNDARRLEAVQKWCQSFGEVDQIMRMPNGDLQVNFQKAEVADTVCRVRAKVYIPSVGSVHLSWCSGSKRP